MLRSSLTISILSIFLSIVSFANQIVIGKYFGTAIQFDQYLAATSLPLMMMGIMGGLFSYLIIPKLVQFRNDNISYSLFLSTLNIFIMLISIMVIIFGYFISPFINSIILPGMNEATKNDTIFLQRLAWISVGTNIIMIFLSSALNVDKKYYLPIFVNMIPYGSTIIFTILFWETLGILTLVIGLLIGQIVGILILFHRIKKDIYWDKRIFYFFGKVLNMFKSIPLILLSMLCFTVYGAIDSFWAIKLEPSSLSYLGYSQRLLIALGNISILGPMTVLLPYLSELSINNKSIELRFVLKKSIKLILLSSGIIAVIVSVLSYPLIKIVFERGLFDEKSTNGLSTILPGMLFGMVAMVCVVIIFRAFYAIGDLKGAGIIGLGCSILYFILSGVLSSIFKLNGIVIAYFVTWWVIFIVAVLRLWKSNMNELFNKENYSFFLQLICTLFASGLLTYICRYLLNKMYVDNSISHLLLQLCISSFFGISSFLTISIKIFGMKEITEVYSSLVMRRK